MSTTTTVYPAGPETAILTTRVDLPAVQKARDDLREKLRSVLAKHARLSGGHASPADRQLVEAEKAFNLARAKVAEIAARKTTAEIEGNAKALAAVNKELVAGLAAQDDAEGLLAAATEIAQRQRAEQSAAVEQAEGALLLDVRQLIDAEAAKVTAEIDKALAVHLPELLACGTAGAFMNSVALRSFIAGY